VNWIHLLWRAVANTIINFRFYESRIISSLSERLLASNEVLYSMGLGLVSKT
jgi:hypothetical protein